MLNKNEKHPRWNAYRRRKRCYHRVISGIEKGGELRFITLTSSPQSPTDIRKSLRRLLRILRSQGFLTDYLRVIELTTAGREHVHMIYRGSYIPHELLSTLWERIHNAPIVDVRRIKPHPRGKHKAASYMAKEMSKQGYRRYSWSWFWVYKGFVKVWKLANSLLRTYNKVLFDPVPFGRFLRLWQAHLHTGLSPPAFLNLLHYQLSQLNGGRLYPGAPLELHPQPVRV